jgi:hypothetical protein
LDIPEAGRLTASLYIVWRVNCRRRGGEEERGKTYWVPKSKGRNQKIQSKVSQTSFKKSPLTFFEVHNCVLNDTLLPI